MALWYLKKWERFRHNACPSLKELPAKGQIEKIMLDSPVPGPV